MTGLFGFTEHESAADLPSFLDVIGVPSNIRELRLRWFGIIEDELRTYITQQCYPLQCDITKIVDQVRDSLATSSFADTFSGYGSEAF